ncbi:MAG TPA: CrcB family protein, partial [Candidatus Thalassarchaeaceae archaeon]|nr:CrcB family protein [Candidatus Thalassarchaeaceae archaeon]
LGAMFGAIAAGSVLSEETVLLLGTGVLGAFTTMSTFAVDAIRIGDDNPSNSITMALITVVGSIGLAWVGWRLTAAIMA